MGSPLHIAPLPDVLFIELAHGHFLADGVNPIVKVFCICLIFSRREISGRFPAGICPWGLTSMSTQTSVLQRHPYICRCIFRLFAGSLQIFKRRPLLSSPFFISFFSWHFVMLLSMTERALTRYKDIIAYLSTFLFADTISIMGRRISSCIPGISIMYSGGCGSTI